MEKRTHSIRFRLGTTLLWDSNTTSFLELKHMKYNLILNKFLILFLEKYKIWYCIHYYTVFSKQPFLFFFFFYLKNYANKRLKLFRIGSLFRKFILKTKKKQKRKINITLNPVLTKVRLKPISFTIFNNINFSAQPVFNFFIFNSIFFKSYLNILFGAIRKKSLYRIKQEVSRKKIYNKARLKKVQRFHYYNRVISVYLKHFYNTVIKKFYGSTLFTGLMLLNTQASVKKNDQTLLFFVINPLLFGLVNMTKLVYPAVRKNSLFFLRLKLLKKIKLFSLFGPFQKSFNILSVKNKMFFFKFFFLSSLAKYNFWYQFFMKKTTSITNKKLLVRSFKKVVRRLKKNVVKPTVLSFYKSFVFKKKIVLQKNNNFGGLPQYIMKQNKKVVFNNYRRWLAIKLFQVQLSLNLGLLLSKAVSVHLINSFSIVPKIFQPKTFRILNSAICRRYFIKNLRDRSFILNFLNLFFLCSYFKFINSLVRFLASELVVRRRMKQLKFINLLKKILISEFFDQFLSKLQILGFYVLITGKIGRKPRTQTMSILKNFRSVQTSQVKISYSCKKSITFFGVLSVKFWLYYV